MANNTNTVTNNQIPELGTLDSAIAAALANPEAKAKLEQMIGTSVPTPQAAPAAQPGPIGQVVVQAPVQASAEDSDSDSEDGFDWAGTATSVAVVAGGVFLGGMAAYGAIKLIDWLGRD